MESQVASGEPIKGMMARTVRNFPELFSGWEKANIVKAMRWWKDIKSIWQEYEYA